MLTFIIGLFVGIALNHYRATLWAMVKSLVKFIIKGSFVMLAIYGLGVILVSVV